MTEILYKIYQNILVDIFTRVGIYFLLRFCVFLAEFFLGFFDFLQKVLFLPDATLHPRTFLHLLGVLTRLPLQSDFPGIITYK